MVSFLDPLNVLYTKLPCTVRGGCQILESLTQELHEVKYL